MKKSTLKIIIAVLSLTVLVCVAMCVSVNAANAPEIISKNVKVDGNYSLMFAVDPATVAGSDVTLNIYDRAPANGVTAIQTITKAKTATTKIALHSDGVADDEVIVFETQGVSAKDIADVWYVTTTSNGVTSSAMTYSVREYAFERLYKNNTVFAQATDENAYTYYQKQFYLELLDVGSAAQQLLVNYKLSSEGKPTEKLAKEYIYFAIKGGTYTIGDCTSTHGFVDNAAVATLTSTDEEVKAWQVYTFGQNGGTISTQIVATGSTVTVAGNTVAVPYAPGVTAGKYFDEVGVKDYNFTGKDWNFIQPAKGYMAHTKLTGAAEAETHRGYAMYAFEASGDADHGNVFHMAHQENDYNFAVLMHFPVQETVENPNCLVLEYDMKLIDGIGCYSDAEAARQLYTAMIFSWNGAELATVASKTTATAETQALFKRNMNLFDKDKEYTDAEFEVANSSYATYKTGGDALRFEGVTTDKYDINKGEWHNICFEIYTDVNKVVYYVDGVAVYEGDFTEAIDISKVLTNSIQFEPRLRNLDVMVDNVYSGKIAKTYKAQ